MTDERLTYLFASLVCGDENIDDMDIQRLMLYVAIKSVTKESIKKILTEYELLLKENGVEI